MVAVAYIVIYIGVLVFMAGCLRRILQYARTPVHLRWELYPVPHEEPSLAKHGGSYFESTGWWTRPQANHRAGEWSAMFQEIAFMKSLREFNPKLWIPSFLFHGGLYLSICFLALILAATLPGLLFPAWQDARVFVIMLRLAAWLGYAGEVLVLAGALLLLLRRMTDAALKNYTKASDIFNLLFFLVTFAFLAAGSFVPARHASMAEIARALLRFDRRVEVGALLATGLILASLLAAWIPFTHMAHFIAKYFTWHSVRWDDERMKRGSAIEARTALAMGYRPTWSATHFGADGKTSWTEIAAAAPAPETKK